MIGELYMHIPKAEIRQYNRSPVLFVDDRPVSLLAYSEGVGLSARHHKQFWDIGVEVYELSGQNVPIDKEPASLSHKGIIPHEYCVRGGKCGIDMSLGWIGPETFNYTWIDRSINEALHGALNAYIIPRVWLEPPGWWLDLHPEELQQYGDGFQGIDSAPGGARRVSFASELWLSESSEALRRFVEHVQRKYTRHIIGYHIAAGLWGEWHYNCAHHLPDTSEPMRLAFVAFLRNKYQDDIELLRQAWQDESVTFETVTVPKEVERCKEDLGVLRDPRVCQKVIDYYYCHHNVLANAVLTYAKVIKETSYNRSLVVVFYGYTRDVGCIHEAGHLELQSVLNSPYVDCLCSPHSYRHRYAGLDGGFRALPGSIRLHNKQFFDEQDELTHIFEVDTVSANTLYYGGYPPRSRYEAIQLAKRQFVQTLTEGVGAWWFGCMIENRFDDPEIMKAFEEFVRIDKQALKRPRNRVSEVAIFVSCESVFYTTHWKRENYRLVDSLLNEQWSELFRIGAPFDVYDIEDLTQEHFPEGYKCYIFLNVFYTSPQVRKAIEALKRGGKTLVWFYAPGAITEGMAKDRPSIIQFSENASALTGIELRVEPVPTSLRVKLVKTVSEWAKEIEPGTTWRLSGSFAPTVAVADPDVEILAEVDGSGLSETYGRPGWVVKKMKNWTSMYFLGPTVPASILRSVIRATGCHIYLESEDNLYVTQSYLGIHASRAGRKTVILPRPARVVNLFDSAWRQIEGTRFEVDMSRYETVLFSIEELQGSHDNSPQISESTMINKDTLEVRDYGA
jgi:hypothetical protein